LDSEWAIPGGPRWCESRGRVDGVPSEIQRRIIRALKGLDSGAETESIPIVDETGKVLGALRPIDATSAEDDRVPGLLAVWRNSFAHRFLTQFEATPRGMREWLNTTVIPADDRILFLVLDGSGKPVGYCGTREVTEHAAELAVMVRGESGGGRRMMLLAEVTLLNWMYNVLGVGSVWLQVFSDNQMASMLHEMVGFAVSKTYRMTKTVDDRGTTYTVDRACCVAPGEFGLTEMRLSRAEFSTRFGWLALPSRGAKA